MRLSRSLFNFLLVIAGVSAVSLCLFVTMQSVLLQCWPWECPPRRDFWIRDIEMPTALFPEGLIVNQLSPLSDSFETLEDGSSDIYWPDGRGYAACGIMRMPTEASAKREYQRSLKLFYEGSNFAEPPSVLTFRSQTADEFHLGCRENERGYQCGALWRFDEYVMDFISTIDQRMSYAAFQRIVEYLDRQLSSRLGLSP